MNLPSQIKEKEQTLTELMARILKEPLKPLLESLQKSGTELTDVKLKLKGILESMDDTREEVENGNDTLHALKLSLTELRNQDMASMKNGLTEIKTVHNQMDLKLQALTGRLADTEEKLNGLTRVTYQGQESIREQCLAFQVIQRADSQTMLDALAQHTTYCKEANETKLAAFTQSANTHIVHFKALQSTVGNIVNNTEQLREHAREESEKNREDMTGLSEKHAVLEARLEDTQKCLRSHTLLMRITLVCLAILIGLQFWGLIRT